jgi:hypothetical protein
MDMREQERGAGRLSGALAAGLGAGLLLAGLGCATTYPVTPPTTEPAGGPVGIDAVNALGWMAGTWTGTDANGVEMEETWSPPKGGMLLGTHRDVASGKVVEFEDLRIDTAGETATYWASPMGAPPVPFRIKELGPGPRVVFENPEHDFPQRILYWITPDGLMHARIEGPEKKGEKDMEWVWTKTGEVSPLPE